MPQDLIIVDARNRAIGRDTKRRVHERGLLHRAFSIFLVDRDGRVLLQRRHRSKYHSGGLWANSCCGHPRPAERTIHHGRRQGRDRHSFRSAFGTGRGEGWETKHDLSRKSKEEGDETK